MAILENDLQSLLLDIKLLKGIKDNFRLRVWKYRFLFRKDAIKIVIYFYDADTRGDIYK
jgi:mRNA interferase RelE/StbE